VNRSKRLSQRLPFNPEGWQPVVSHVRDYELPRLRGESLDFPTNCELCFLPEPSNSGGLSSKAVGFRRPLS
jgi:hypothetical protein